MVRDFPLISQIIDDLIPKKSVVYKMRLKDNGKTDLIIVDNKVICFKYYKTYIPTLRLLH
jgi:predicted ribosome-associated RNA-binding protein Tma20